MGNRIVLAEGEAIGNALKRFRKMLERNGKTWEERKRGLLIQPNGCFFKSTTFRRAKKFQKRFKARTATLLAKRAGEQTGEADGQAFWKKTGKP